jgi:hypothetical protein
LRGVGYPKRLVNSVSGHPHNSIHFVDDNRHRVARRARHLPIHEKVLELFAAIQPDRSKSVAGAPISYGQTSRKEVPANKRDVVPTPRAAVAHDCTHVSDEVSAASASAERDTRFRQRDLSWIDNG